MLSRHLRTVADAVVHNPVASAITGTTVVCSAMLWRQYSSTHAVHIDAQREIREQIEHTSESMRKTTRELDAQITTEVKRKDDLLQRLHLQNVEQSRSIDRLVSSLKACQIPLPRRGVFAEIDDA